jgi:DNA-binding response OmpR family regulator
MAERILIVENEERWKDAFKQMLRRTSYELHVVSNCENAEKLLKEMEFVLVVINMNLSDIPEVTNDQLGFDLLELLQAGYALTPRIVITGEINGPIFSTYLPFGVSDVLYKPTLTRPQLLETIERALRQRNRPKTAYNRAGFCRLLDAHTTDLHVRLLQQHLRDRYSSEPGFSSYSNVQGDTKYDKLDYVLGVLESYQEVFVAGQLIMDIKPDDKLLRSAIEGIEWA